MEIFLGGISVSWCPMPRFFHFRPARGFLLLFAIGRHFAKEPEVEPSQIALIDIQPMGWLSFDMFLVGKNEDIDRTVRRTKRINGFECRDKFPISRLNENGKCNSLGIAREGDRRPYGGA